MRSHSCPKHYPFSHLITTHSTYYKIYWQLYPNFYLTSKLQCIMDKNRFIHHCMTFWFWTGLSTFHHQHWRMGSIDLIHNWKRTFDFLDFDLLEALECSVVKMYEVKPQLTIAQLKSDWLGKKAKKSNNNKKQLRLVPVSLLQNTKMHVLQLIYT